MSLIQDLNYERPELSVPQVILTNKLTAIFTSDHEHENMSMTFGFQTSNFFRVLTPSSKNLLKFSPLLHQSSGANDGHSDWKLLA